jgi:RHS repeat-associated protein
MLSQASNISNQISGFCYDQAGNLLAQAAPPCPSPTYNYNAEGQLISAVGVTYTYDGDGRRVMKSNGKLYWYGVGSDALDETDLAGNTNNASFKEYIFFGSKRIASRDSSNNVNYYFADHLGTARIVANSSGTILDDSDFYPYGGERVVLSSSGNTYKFDGKERDSETGNDDFGARFYSSNLGRWLSADWSAIPVPVPYANLTNPQTLNLYAIVNDNPVTFADLDGHLNANGGQDISPNATAGVPACKVDPIKCQKPAQNQKPQYDNPQNEAEARLSNVVYNETSSLRPDPNSKPGTGGSAEALQDAREGIAEVANRVIDSGHPERVAPSELNDKDRRALSSGNADAINAHNASLAAARQALGGANNTSGDTQYRLRTRSVNPDRPINGKDTNFVYGPFINTIGRRETIVFAP